ncbi:MAG: hypothetical protein LBU89_05965 [Fibromonadaceae bacterium]|jgi:hypothetical protein|nr:hypothetical protein [Fibromonadaceae bacterium]
MSKHLYIYGAGKYGVLAALDCEQRGVKVAGFIDANADKIKTRLGVPVLALEEFYKNNREGEDVFIYISLTNIQIIEQLYFQLSNLGFKFLQDFDISPLISVAWINNVNAIAIELHERLKPGCNRSFYKGTGVCFPFEESRGETVWLWR